MGDDAAVICSAKGCRKPAGWALVWANPRIHTGGRTKTWVACDVHRPTLAQFLEVRGFLQRVEPLEVAAPGADAAPGASD